MTEKLTEEQLNLLQWAKDFMDNFERKEEAKKKRLTKFWRE